MFDCIYSLRELNLCLRGLKVCTQLRRRVETLTHSDNLVKDPVLLALNYPSIVDEGANSKPLIFAPSPLKELLPIRTN